MAKKSLKMHKRASTETELENAQFYFFDEEIFLVPPFNFDFLNRIVDFLFTVVAVIT